MVIYRSRNKIADKILIKKLFSSASFPYKYQILTRMFTPYPAELLQFPLEGTRQPLTPELSFKKKKFSLGEKKSEVIVCMQ